MHVHFIKGGTVVKWSLIILIVLCQQALGRLQYPVNDFPLALRLRLVRDIEKMALSALRKAP